MSADQPADVEDTSELRARVMRETSPEGLLRAELRGMLGAEGARGPVDVDRLIGHSVQLNTIGWRIATALGDVPEGAAEVDGDPVGLADRLIAEVVRLRAEIDTAEVALDASVHAARIAEVLRKKVWQHATPGSIAHAQQVLEPEVRNLIFQVARAMVPTAKAVFEDDEPTATPPGGDTTLDEATASARDGVVDALAAEYCRALVEQAAYCRQVFTHDGGNFVSFSDAARLIAGHNVRRAAVGVDLTEAIEAARAAYAAADRANRKEFDGEYESIMALGRSGSPPRDLIAEAVTAAARVFTAQHAAEVDRVERAGERRGARLASRLIDREARDLTATLDDLGPTDRTVRTMKVEAYRHAALIARSEPAEGGAADPAPDPTVGQLSDAVQAHLAAEWHQDLCGCVGWPRECASDLWLARPRTWDTMAVLGATRELGYVVLTCGELDAKLARYEQWGREQAAQAIEAAARSGEQAVDGLAPSTRISQLTFCQALRTAANIARGLTPMPLPGEPNYRPATPTPAGGEAGDLLDELAAGIRKAARVQGVTWIQELGPEALRQMADQWRRLNPAAPPEWLAFRAADLSEQPTEEATDGDLHAALTSIHSTMAFNSRDWSTDKADAWLYGIACGWDESLDDVAADHGWAPASVDRLRAMNAAFESVTEGPARPSNRLPTRCGQPTPDQPFVVPAPPAEEPAPAVDLEAHDVGRYSDDQVRPLTTYRAEEPAPAAERMEPARAEELAPEFPAPASSGYDGGRAAASGFEEPAPAGEACYCRCGPGVHSPKCPLRPAPAPTSGKAETDGV